MAANFEWNDKSNKSQQEPDEEQELQEIMQQRLLYAVIFDGVYMILRWLQMGIGVLCMFAWLWKTPTKEFATFLFFVLYVIEKIVSCVQMSVTPKPTVEIVDIEDEGDDQK